MPFLAQSGSVLHGEDDEIVRVRDSAMKSTRLIKGAVDTELLACLRGSPAPRVPDQMMVGPQSEAERSAP